jgi:hypothetical protein
MHIKAKMRYLIFQSTGSTLLLFLQCKVLHNMTHASPNQRKIIVMNSSKIIQDMKHISIVGHAKKDKILGTIAFTLGITNLFTV